MAKSKTTRGLGRYSIAFHEAAHVLAALHVGAKLGRPAALVRDDGSGETRCHPGVGRDAALIHMAGLAAASLLADGRLRGAPNDPLGQTAGAFGEGEEDWKAAACALVGHTPPCGEWHLAARVKRRVETALCRAEALLVRRSDALLDLADALNARGRLSAAEVKRIARPAA